MRIDAEPDPIGQLVAARELDRQQRADEATYTRYLEQIRLARCSASHPNAGDSLPLRCREDRVRKVEPHVPIVQTHGAPARGADIGRHAPSMSYPIRARAAFQGRSTTVPAHGLGICQDR